MLLVQRRSWAIAAVMRRCSACSGPESTPGAVFCYNDPVAAGAIQAALEAGLKVPQEVAIIGAGNVHYSDLLRVSLSTVDQSSTLIGERAAELLVALHGRAPSESLRRGAS